METCEGGANQLVGTNTEQILNALSSDQTPTFKKELYGGGRAAERCVKALLSA